MCRKRFPPPLLLAGAPSALCRPKTFAALPRWTTRRGSRPSKSPPLPSPTMTELTYATDFPLRFSFRHWRSSVPCRPWKTLAALPNTIKAVKSHIFNDIIWPNLSDDGGRGGDPNVTCLSCLVLSRDLPVVRPRESLYERRTGVLAWWA